MKNKLFFFAIIATIGFLAACSSGDDTLATPPAHTHVWGDWTITKEATCSAKGVETRVCTLDPSHEETRETEINPNAHDWEQLEGTAPTCTTEGSGKRKCKLCGKEESGVLPALGHDWGEWIETIAPTDTVDGEEERICRNDPTHKETNAIAALNHTHDWEDEWQITTPATCMAKGEKFRLCKLNAEHKDIEDIEIDPNAHDWGEWIETTPASYIAAGEETQTCNHDSSHKEKRPIPQILFPDIYPSYLSYWLSSQPENTAATPYTLKVNINRFPDLTSVAGFDSLAVSNPNKYFSIDFSDSTFTSIESIAFQNCTTLVGIILPNTVTQILTSAFDGCTSLNTITLPNILENIGNTAFRNCTSLTSINIPASVNSIGSSAFNGCTNLTSVTIPNSVTSITSQTFMNCPSLTRITIPNSVTSIGPFAFGGSTNLTSIRFERAGTSFGANSFAANTTPLQTAYTAGGIGTYTRPDTTSTTWTKVSD
jgi:hypothetical protein